MIQPGDAIPDLPIALSDGLPARLSDYAGRWLVLYFYPKDHTPGCTTEAQDFRDLASGFEARGAAILGVSRDPVKSHQGFITKHRLPFPLVSDADEALCRAFDVIREKNLYGRRFMGIERSTFLIDPQQRVAEAWRKVKVPGHAQVVLDALTARPA